MALVIKQWECGREANEQGNYVHLVGREGGLISWLLSLIGIDPVSEVEVKEDLIKFTSSSLAGKEMRIIPVKSLTQIVSSISTPESFKILSALRLILSGLPFFPIILIAIILTTITIIKNGLLIISPSKLKILIPSRASGKICNLQFGHFLVNKLMGQLQ